MNKIWNDLCTDWVKKISKIYKSNIINKSKSEKKWYFKCINNVL